MHQPGELAAGDVSPETSRELPWHWGMGVTFRSGPLVGVGILVHQPLLRWFPIKIGVCVF